MAKAKQTRKASKAVAKASSRMGRLMSPVDITSGSMLGELDKRIKAGPFTLVLVYADWCGHCQRFKPMMSQLESMPDRSVQTARVRDDMFQNSSLSGTQIDGYPSLLLVKPSGEVTKFQDSQGEVKNTIPDYTNMNNMKAIVKNVGTPEGEAALNASTLPINPEEILTPAPSPMASPIPSTKGVSVSASTKNMKNVDLPVNTTATPVRVSQSKETTGTLPNTILADRLSAQTVQSLNTQMVNSKNALLKQATKPAQAGGSLFGHLAAAAGDVAPAAALLLGASTLAARGRRGKGSRSGRTRRTRRAQRKVRGGRRGCGCGVTRRG